MPALSVIIPCYNVEDYIGQTLSSIRRNISADVEFVFVDDASTDATAELLAAAVDSIPGAQLVTADRNRGLSAARNLGLGAATGSYLTYLDGDDLVAAGYFADLLGTIRRLGCDMVRTDHVQVNGRRRTVHRIAHGPRNTVMSPRDAILPTERPTSVDSPYAWAGIYHRRVADQGLLHFPEQLRTCEDRPWCWRLHLQVESFAVVGLIGLLYRRGVATSLTQTADESQLDFLTAFDQIIADVQADPQADLFLPKAVRAYCAMICHHLRLADRYPPALAARLRSLSAAALARLDPGLVAGVSARMDAERQSVLRSLRGRA